ncbi:oxygenase MpaB family protein [Kineococcus sp. SYSU DK003]|uniref:oxygenase MpaB family protein n=1 Tax=Kineococcus sp. SYSU DK003 TaxID=3383124 RepID=UPI003D7C985B
MPVLLRPTRPRELTARVRRSFRSRVSDDPTGAPDWVRDIALVGQGPGWFEPDGVVWRVHGDLSTLVGGIAALLGQGAHPLALAGVRRHSSYRTDPWGRLAGTARWLVVSTFGSAELADREAARVRGMHERVRGRTGAGRAYSASDPELLRWVHLAFTDAFLAAQQAVGHDLTGRFGRDWPDAYVAQWSCSATALGATDLPTTRRELTDALRALEPDLEPVPADLLGFIAAPTGLNPTERRFYAELAAAGALVLSPSIARFAGLPGRDDRSASARARLRRTRWLLRSFQLALGPYSPSEEAARYRLGLAPAPEWLGAPAH